MPLYEYDCRDCGRRFEKLVRKDETAGPCPHCTSANIERVLSLFGVSSDATRQAHLQSARRANSKVLRDKKIAEEEAAHHDHDH
jgi:putative FmdB family regulatory protein